MPFDIESQKDRIYGRTQDLVVLERRSEHPGLTVVLGRPQQGKTWLLRETARNLHRSGQVAVGFGRSFGETADLMLRAVQDLYARWLTEAGAWGRAKAAFDQPEGWFAGPVKFVLGKLVAWVSGDNPVTEAMIHEALNALILANQEATGAASFLSTLRYDQARDLVAAVHRLSGRRVVLFMDQYQESPDPEGEAKTLRAFLADCDAWPPCHIIVALRAQEAAAAVMRRLVTERPGRGTVYDLKGMDLAGDPQARSRLLEEMRERLPALAEVPDADILGWVEDYPGVLYRWRDMNPTDALALVQERASDAHHGRYPEIKRTLEGLAGNDLSLAVRLALYPTVENADHWNVLRAPLLHGLDSTGLDRLGRARLIETHHPPSFGHARRREVAMGWLVEHASAALGEEINVTVPQLAGQITEVTPAIEPFARALVGLTPMVERPSLCRSLVVTACIQAALGLFGVRVPAGSALDVVVKQTADALPSWAAPVLAIGLFNTLNAAKKEGDLERRDALLDELRAVVAAHSDDAAVRQNLAMGLYNTLYAAKEDGDLEHRDALLEDLRALVADYPEDTAVRQNLAMGLFNTLYAAKEEGDLERRDALLAELRALAAAYPDDAAVREQFAMGLVNTLNAAKDENDLSRRDALLADLRALAADYPEDTVVRDALARGLASRLQHAREDGDPAAVEQALIAELTPLLPHISEGLRALIRADFGL